MKIIEKNNKEFYLERKKKEKETERERKEKYQYFRFLTCKMTLMPLFWLNTMEVI